MFFNLLFMEISRDLIDCLVGIINVRCFFSAIREDVVIAFP